MKDFLVFVKVEVYIRQWLTHALGEPVKFPAGSFENRLLTRLTSKRPPGVSPRSAEAGSVALVLPDNAYHRPEFYNYLSRRSRSAVVSAIDALFRIHLWSECAPLIHAKGELNRGLDAWCVRNGIGLDHREAVRQKFYRMRRCYELSGIILGKKHRNRCHAPGAKRTSPGEE